MRDLWIPRDNYVLHGRLFHAHGDGPFPFVIVLPGIPDGGEDVLGLGEKFSQAGIHALIFSYSGTHRSGGEWIMSNDKVDVGAVYEYVGQPEFTRHYAIDATRIFLGGYSHGGGVALLYAANHPEVKRVFSIGGNDFGEWARRLKKDTKFAQAIDEYFISWAEQGLIRLARGAESELLDNVEVYDVRMRAPLLAVKDVLLIAGLDDQTVLFEDHQLPLYRALQRENAQRVRFVAMQTDHSFGQVYDQIASELIAWIRPGNEELGALTIGS